MGSSCTKSANDDLEPQRRIEAPRRDSDTGENEEGLHLLRFSLFTDSEDHDNQFFRKMMQRYGNSDEQKANDFCQVMLGLYFEPLAQNTKDNLRDLAKKGQEPIFDHCDRSAWFFLIIHHGKNPDIIQLAL